MSTYTLGSDGPFWNGISLVGIQPDISGVSFYVDCVSGSDSNTGKSWNRAFKTIENAIYFSNVNIADSKNTNRRNTIFVLGGPYNSNLTFFPNNTDIVGCGNYNNGVYACIYGSHEVRNGQNTRFYNIHFKGAPGDSIVKFYSAYSGLGAHNCIFDATGGNVEDALYLSNCANLIITECKFGGPFQRSYMTFAAGDLGSFSTYNCDMRGSSNYGFYMLTGTLASEGASIEKCLIATQGACISDASGKFAIIDNRLFTKRPKGTAGIGAIACNVNLAQNNRITCSDLRNAMFPAQGIL